MKSTLIGYILGILSITHGALSYANMQSMATRETTLVDASDLDRQQALLLTQRSGHAIKTSEFNASSGYDIAASGYAQTSSSNNIAASTIRQAMSGYALASGLSIGAGGLIITLCIRGSRRPLSHPEAGTHTKTETETLV